MQCSAPAVHPTGTQAHLLLPLMLIVNAVFMLALRIVARFLDNVVAGEVKVQLEAMFYQPLKWLSPATTGYIKGAFLTKYIPQHLSWLLSNAFCQRQYPRR